MAETAHYDGVMDFVDSAPKRRCLDHEPIRLPPLLELSNNGQSQYTHDDKTDPNRTELESGWALTFSQISNSDFSFSGFESSDLNTIANQDELLRNSTQLFSNDSLYQDQQTDFELEQSFEQDLLTNAASVVNEPAAAPPIIDQVCYGMVIYGTEFSYLFANTPRLPIFLSQLLNRA